MSSKKNPASAATLDGVGIHDLAVGGSIPQQATKNPSRTPPDLLPPVIAALRRRAFGQWRLTLDSGAVVNLQTSELQSYRKFARAAEAQTGAQFSVLNANAWLALVDDALRPLRGGRP